MDGLRPSPAVVLLLCCNGFRVRRGVLASPLLIPPILLYCSDFGLSRLGFASTHSLTAICRLITRQQYLRHPAIASRDTGRPPPTARPAPPAESGRAGLRPLHNGSIGIVQPLSGSPRPTPAATAAAVSLHDLSSASTRRGRPARTASARSWRHATRSSGDRSSIHGNTLDSTPLRLPISRVPVVVLCTIGPSHLCADHVDTRTPLRISERFGQPVVPADELLARHRAAPKSGS